MKVKLKLNEYREKAGLSQRALAKEAGLAQCLVCQYNNGKVMPSIETMVRLAKPLGIKWHELVIIEGEEE
ncbi:transcriptional regulator [Klebsiella phage EKq1]|uniref:HTH cro/C1-type domain-containing protein n=1 Tax=Klebsiella phage PMBT64 TaxID=3229740 RepID=A0AB39C2T0_9CAUD|nr:helix-turn-helix transcriptional repressor [Klebsiella phage vB_KleS-HSE3]UVX29765.1 transcriptional regulator [Klebsiella phage VLCpiS8c]WNV46696.1 transcriptional regulator [Klebsiella phage EKq1]BEH84570.1 hypothetical protein [Klebsiella phage phiKp_7-2]